MKTLTCIPAVVAAVVLACFAPGEALAATYCVDDASDGAANAADCAATCDGSNDCSLRDALTAANASVGVADVIQFGIVGGGVQVISPTLAFPAITDTLTIDATTQPGYPGANTSPLIELNGVGIVAANDGLSLQANGCVIEGLAINRFNGAGIRIQADNSVLRSNFIGTDATGLIDRGNIEEGVVIASGTNNDIGGSGAGEGNVISGNTGAGVLIQSTGNRVIGNRIGTDVTGTATGLGNAASGLVIDGGNDTEIGGTAAGERNTVSGNSNHGIEIVTGTGTVIRGNYIGADINGTGVLGNGDKGIYTAGDDTVIGGSAAGAANVVSTNGTDGIAVDDADRAVIRGNFIGTDPSGALNLGNGNAGVILEGQDSSVGGTAAGEGNTIAFNGLDAVTVRNQATSTGNAILRNSMHSNGGLGIDLADDNLVTANDALDADTGPNNLQNFPVMTVARHSSGTTLFEGVLNGAAGINGIRIEFFSSAVCHGSGNGEGQTFLGATTVNTDGAGTVSFSTTFPLVLAADLAITATATDPLDNTSEFSACIDSESSGSSGFLGGGGAGGGGGPSCGDGTVDTGEECDDGNAVNGDGCSVSCLNESGIVDACGNGVKQSGEPCDDGDTTNGDGCNADCGVEVTPAGNEIELANPSVDFSDLVERDAYALTAPDLPGTCTCVWSVDPSALMSFDPSDACDTDVALNFRGTGTLSVTVYCGREGSGTFSILLTVDPIGSRSGSAGSGGSSGGCSLIR